VKHGDVIAEVEADKGAFEVQVFEDGVIDQILVQPGDARIPVGTALATIRSEAVAVVEKAERVPPKIEAVEAPGPGEVRPLERPVPVQPPVTIVEKRIRVSPLARKVAAELGIDLNIVQGTGLHGAIERADVERAAEAKRLAQKAAPAPVVEAVPPPPTPPVMEKAPPPAPAERPKGDFQAAMRRAIAAAMSRANREIPHYYLQTPIDMSHALHWLEEENLKRPIKQRILPAVLLIKAVARALTDIPELNGYWIDDHHEPQEAIHIGFAISLRQGGLIAPAIHDVDLKNLDEIMEALHSLIARTRSGGLRSSEMTDATITVTNLGDMGVETVYGVIYPPQVALVGFGKVTDHTWVDNGMIGIRPVLTATLAADHRATDGRRGAQFLDALNGYLQEVEKL
jgi:pyruvate dehydrogenase E2 component (dihydrolipoamide acetyltransferase)